jgi:ubiquitin C-terminal hydrolase
MQHQAKCTSKSSQELCIYCWASHFIPNMRASDKFSSALFPKVLANHPHLVSKTFRPHRQVCCRIDNFWDSIAHANCILHTLQEDSHEFLRCFLDKMHRVTLKLAGVKEGTKDRRDETDELHRIFGGYFCNQVHCPACGYDSNRFDSFMDLSLEVGNGIHSVEKALNHFAQTEILDDGNKWNCPKCKKSVCARKQMTIRKVRVC